MIKHIDVMGHRIKIEHKSIDDESHGDYDRDKLVIRINPDSTADKDSTLFHEVIHSIMELSGLSEVLEDKLEEAITRCIERNLYPILQRGHFNSK